MATRQEFNLLGLGTIFVDSSQQIQVDTNALGGTVTYAFETYARVSSGTGTVTLRRVGTTTDDATISVTATDLIRQRVSFTPPNGATDYFIRMSGGADLAIVGSRVLVFQNGAITKTQTQIEIGSWVTGLSNTTDAALARPKYWNYASAIWDGTVTAYAEVVWSGSGTMYTKTFKLQVDDGSFGGWADVVTIVASTASAVLRSRSTSFTLTTGRNYRLVGSISNNMETYSVFCAKVVIDSTNSPLKFEPQFFLTETSGTGVVRRGLLYDPAEWSGGTFNYYHEGQSVNAGTTDLELVDPTVIPGSPITDCIERERTGALTMPGASVDDVGFNVVQFGSNVTSRIIVQVSLTAPAQVFFNNRTLRPRPFAP